MNGSAKTVGAFAQVVRTFQSGLINRYTFVMIAGLFLLLTWWLRDIVFAVG